MQFGRGRLSLQISFEGIVTEFRYDRLTDQVAQRRFFGNFADYDNGVEPPAEVWSYEYDALGRETSVVISSNEPTAPARVFSTTYDAQGRVVQSCRLG